MARKDRRVSSTQCRLKCATNWLVSVQVLPQGGDNLPWRVATPEQMMRAQLRQNKRPNHLYSQCVLVLTYVNTFAYNIAAHSA
jgi:hypothetical protein